MLISFKVRNYLSFNEEQELNLLKLEKDKHAYHALKKPVLGMQPLHSAIIFGANASGKSNLVRAMGYAKNCITNKEVRRPERFDLEEAGGSFFSFTLLADKKVYNYSFSIKGTEILEETLTQIITKDEKEKEIFSRKAQNDREEDRLYLNTIVKSNKHRFKKIAQTVYDWFDKSLGIVPPEGENVTEVSTKVGEDCNFSDFLNEIMRKADTGIDSVFCEDLLYNDELFEKIKVPKDFIEHIIEQMKKDVVKEQKNAVAIINGVQIFVELQGNKKDFSVSAKEFYFNHKSKSGQVISRKLERQSDGTKRLFFLSLHLYDLKSSSGKVLVFDELERSLHPILMKKIINQVMLKKMTETGKEGEQNYSQIILATHALNLLEDEKLFQDDQVYLLEKNHGQTEIMQLAEYPKNDRKNRKKTMEVFLQGGFGGVPYTGGLPL